MTEKRKLPIDIQYKQLLETLIDRHIVPQKWLEQYEEIREAIATLYPELPLASEALSKFRAKVISHEAINYFDCKLLFQYLEQSEEGATKNFFGQYNSPLLKRWKALIRQYEKNNIFTAEAARTIAQNTAFEIPFLKRTIQQNQKQITYSNRKVTDLTRSIAEYKRKLEVLSADMGILGHNFRDELRRLPLELPFMFDGVGKAICSEKIDAAMKYHQALQTYLHDCDTPAVASVSEFSNATALSKDKMIKIRGNQHVEVFDIANDWPSELTGIPHGFFGAIKELQIARDGLMEVAPPLNFEIEAVDINWDITCDGSATADVEKIDWDIGPAASTNAAAAIDDVPVEIDWGITSSDVEEPLGDVNTSEAADVIEAISEITITNERPSRGSLLSCSDFRTRILNDLLEMRAFFLQRLAEITGGDSVAFANQYQGSSRKKVLFMLMICCGQAAHLEDQSKAQIEDYQSAVNQAISLLTSNRLQQLVLLKTSDRYLDRLVANFEMLTKHMDKCRREIYSLEDKIGNLIDATKNTQFQVEALVVTTKTLKKELEAALPSLFKGHKINIVGEVNTL
ncbi:hypothetical protein CCR75_000390 [Bremia lactucae]|uniref:CDK5RAP3-like protein n=1 Tax=Bremia lactucae TaxID=4779 RepID=A0A976FPS1_BRELC|nr:hypothetical protein CCR75_000390 [Bremia lactucae]